MSTGSLAPRVLTGAARWPLGRRSMIAAITPACRALDALMSFHLPGCCRQFITPKCSPLRYMLLGSSVAQFMYDTGVPSAHRHLPSEPASVRPTQNGSVPPNVETNQFCSAALSIVTRCPSGSAATVRAILMLATSTTLYAFPVTGLCSHAAGRGARTRTAC